MLSGALLGSSSASVCAASSARGPAALAVAERARERAELPAKARDEQRDQAALQPERRRVLAGEQRRELDAPEREHARGLARVQAHRVPVAVEQGDLAHGLTASGAPDLDPAISGQVEGRGDGAVDDEQQLAALSALVPEDLALLHGASSDHARERCEVCLVLVREQGDGGEEVDGLAVRHRGPGPRTRRLRV